MPENQSLMTPADRPDDLTCGDSNHPGLDLDQTQSRSERHKDAETKLWFGQALIQSPHNHPSVAPRASKAA